MEEMSQCVNSVAGLLESILFLDINSFLAFGRDSSRVDQNWLWSCEWFPDWITRELPPCPSSPSLRFKEIPRARRTLLTDDPVFPPSTLSWFPTLLTLQIPLIVPFPSLVNHTTPDPLSTSNARLATYIVGSSAKWKYVAPCLKKKKVMKHFKRPTALHEAQGRTLLSSGPYPTTQVICPWRKVQIPHHKNQNPLHRILRSAYKSYYIKEIQN